MLPDANLPPVEYASQATHAREPKLWVFVVLAVINFAGILCGFSVWYALHRPGFDPMAELRVCGPVGVGVGTAFYLVAFRRTWRLTGWAVSIAFSLGALTGLSAVVWHLL